MFIAKACVCVEILILKNFIIDQSTYTKNRILIHVETEVLIEKY